MTTTLIDRLIAATGPDHGLDAEIEVATGNWTVQHYDTWWNYQMAGDSANPALHTPVPPNQYTGSIDTALRLFPGGTDYALAMINGRAYAGIGKDHSPTDSDAPTLPLAICLAAMKARTCP